MHISLGTDKKESDPAKESIKSGTADDDGLVSIRGTIEGLKDEQEAAEPAASVVLEGDDALYD